MKANRKNIAAARQKRGHTQKQAAHSLGYAMRSWQDWEAGRRTMRQVIFDAYLRETPQ